jgi:hypothetical protein
MYKCIYTCIYIYMCVRVSISLFTDLFLRILYLYLYPHDIPLSDYTPMTWQVSPFFETNCADRATGAWPVGACFRRLREGGVNKGMPLVI